MACSVLQTTGTVEFDDDLRTVASMEAAGALRVTAPSLGSFLNTSGGAGWSWGRYSCHRDPPLRPNSNSAEFRSSVMLNHSNYVVLGLNWS